MLKTGETYRGTLLESEDNWNCQLQGITHTGRDGRVNQLEHAYIRGSKIRFLVIPDMLKNAPMFKRIDPRTGARGGRGGRGGGGGGGGVGARSDAPRRECIRRRARATRPPMMNERLRL